MPSRSISQKSKSQDAEALGPMAWAAHGTRRAAKTIRAHPKLAVCAAAAVVLALAGVQLLSSSASASSSASSEASSGDAASGDTAASNADAPSAGSPSSRQSLGMFAGWGAFRDPSVPRCYAVAIPDNSYSSAWEVTPYADIGFWPERQLRRQVHFRASRTLKTNAPIRLIVGRRQFLLSGAGRNAWPSDRKMDGLVVSAMRSAGTMRLTGTAANGSTFADDYPLSGAASAIDAAALGCPPKQ